MMEYGNLPAWSTLSPKERKRLSSLLSSLDPCAPSKIRIGGVVVSREARELAKKKTPKG